MNLVGAAEDGGGQRVDIRRQRVDAAIAIAQLHFHAAVFLGNLDQQCTEPFMGFGGPDLQQGKFRG
ncbi:hypothetical protein D3C76_1863200 [compost metagenome]